ncbi:cell wall-binding repeat-containing protein [Clostridium magnum]|uniref:N-acetylmuramoyl-L-alanine amidase LytC n=1 Tax=Clostridium magnum DSM 2767 TaxID=1121326 RepID=A0A162SR45_9CLOT|nr:cell wall-binding repeat-containing protein [Clostridium magnum]KZL91757.1 N-acetylmuramoyl-L-alanine amidase LytC precursor [Clostridium magnum DSM 2767]SHJ02867.1 Putative cell wall-binding protein [Clostridium magnum DSM 2767]
MFRRKMVLSLMTSILALGMYATKAHASTIDMKRIWGGDRYDTARKILNTGWTNTDCLVVASGENFPDALCAVPLARKYNAPIMLVGKNGISGNNELELAKLGLKHVFIVGGKGSVSEDCENVFRAYCDEPLTAITRFGGNNRYETSKQVAEYLGANNGVVIANGENFPDALSIAPIAGIKGMPILLSLPNTLPDSTSSYIKDKNVTKSYVVGGSAVVSDDILSQLPNAKRLAGNSRYSTNAAVINEFKDSLNFANTYMASGQNFPDALSGSALAALNNAPMFLVNDSNSQEQKDIIQGKLASINKITMLGGYSVVKYNPINNLIDGINEAVIPYQSGWNNELKYRLNRYADSPEAACQWYQPIYDQLNYILFQYATGKLSTEEAISKVNSTKYLELGTESQNTIVRKYTYATNSTADIYRTYGIFSGMCYNYSNCFIYYDAKTNTNTIYAIGTRILPEN